jgi:hypothetical protein
MVRISREGVDFVQLKERMLTKWEKLLRMLRWMKGGEVECGLERLRLWRRE